MFMNYPLEQWIGVGEWFLMMVILFIGAGVLSCILANKIDLLHKKKNNYKPKKIKNKSWFIDVA